MSDFFAIGNYELQDQPEVHEGDMIICPHCGDSHQLEAGTNKDRNKNEIILIYRCGENMYLAAVNCKLLPEIERSTQ